MRRRLYILMLLLLVPLTARAEDLQQCTLSAARSGKLYGPFVLQDGFLVDLQSERFYVERAPGRQVSFKRVGDGERFGPYDVALGRMLRLGEQLYTLVDIGRVPFEPPIRREPIPAPAPVTPPVPVQPTTETAAVSPPILAPAPPTAAPKPPRTPSPAPPGPVAVPVVPRPPVQPAPRPTPATKPAPVRTTRPVTKPPRTAVQPRRNPAAATRYATQPKAVQPTKAPTWTAQQPKPVPYRAPATPRTGTAEPSRRTIPWEPERSPRVRRDSLADRPMVALDLSFYEAVAYDRELSGSGVTSESSVSRNSAGLTFRWLPVTVRAGLVLRAAWDEDLPGDGAAFEDVDIDGGNGWWGDIGLQYPVWTSGAWQLDVRGTVGVRKESYDLTYGAWQQTELLTTPQGTNLTEETVVLVQELANTTQAADFSETLLELGLTLSHGTETWCAYSSLDLVAYHDAELDSVIEAGGASYTISLERSQPFIISLGGCFRRNNVNWFGELSLIGETAFRVGSAYTF